MIGFNLGMREAPLNLDGEYPGTVFREDIHLTEHTATQLAHGHSLPAATELTNGTQLATCHIQISNDVQIANRHSLPAATELANGAQLANCHTAR